MRQTATEKIDPLARIQEEIKEVVRREQEYRQLTSATMSVPLAEYDEPDGHINENISNNNNMIDDNSNDISMSHGSLPKANVVVTSLAVQEDNPSNVSSLSSSINSKESLDGHHSDDSGISASSSPAHDNINKCNDELKGASIPHAREQRYIGPNCYNITPEPPQQKLITRTVSTPHLTSTKRQFAFTSAHKGVMQRFIASRGKLQLNNNNAPSNQILLSGKNAVTFLGVNLPANAMPPNTPISAINTSLISPEFGASRHPGSIIISTSTMAPTVIERDADGKPIRPGYIPVEVKIQRELKDLKTRESELKKIRKIRQSTPDLLDAIDNENVDTDDEDESDVEHCYGPGKLRSAKSINELCDSNHSISPRTTPSPDFEHKSYYHRNGGIRPAMSLAQLCDLDPEQAPSSHRLIAQWESLIQQNA